MDTLFEKLEAYGKSEYYPFHMPGHKRRGAGALSEELARLDITEIDGFDNLHHPQGLFLRIQDRIARLYGAEESFCMVNGSTGGILSAVSAALPVGGHMLMARNCHRSVYHAAYLRNLKISYLYPETNKEFGICEAVTPRQVQAALERDPDIDAVFLVSPTYEGRIADIRGIAQAVHDRGLPLIVDEAHGAHLGLAEGFGRNSCQAGADLVIHSVHKTLPALTQTALLHVNGERVDRERLKRFLNIYQSSSPSYILMASIDNVMDVIERQGFSLFADFRNRYLAMLRKLGHCEILRFSPREPEQDIGKLLISGSRGGISGRRIYDILRLEYGLQPEMAAPGYCLAMFTVGDSAEGYDRMTKALKALDRRIRDGEIPPDCETGPGEAGSGEDWLTPGDAGRGEEAASYPGENLQREEVCSLTEAWDLETEWVPLEKASGNCAGGFVNLYPPGIPLLAPGEKITEKHCRLIAGYIRQGLQVQGAEPGFGNASCRKLCIIKERQERDSYAHPQGGAAIEKRET